MHAEDVGAGPEGFQGTADPVWTESSMGPPRYDEDTRERLKPVELVVQRRSREATAECLGSRSPGAPGALRPGGWHHGSAGGRRTCCAE